VTRWTGATARRSGSFEGFRRSTRPDTAGRCDSAGARTGRAIDLLRLRLKFQRAVLIGVLGIDLLANIIRATSCNQIFMRACRDCRACRSGCRRAASLRAWQQLVIGQDSRSVLRSSAMRPSPPTRSPRNHNSPASLRQRRSRYRARAPRTGVGRAGDAILNLRGRKLNSGWQRRPLAHDSRNQIADPRSSRGRPPAK